MTAPAQRIRVKFLGTYNPHAWIRQFPDNIPVWGNCEFALGPEATDYDWLVVYNDLPSKSPEQVLPCPQQQTILVTTEPSSIKSYGSAFTAQFGYVLTSQEPWALPHPQRIYSQPALQWYYGLGQTRLRSYRQMADTPPLHKSRLLSTVCSTKQQRHTLHQKRYRFTQALKERIPWLDIYGHGVQEIDDKAESLDAYRYQLAIENHISLHHWTEKLSDVFLGAALPFYCGCPNAADYFPPESFIPLDINDVEGSCNIILQAIEEQQYERRLNAILEARRRVLEDYNIFSVLTRIITERHPASPTRHSDGVVLSRRLLRKRRPLVALQSVYEKARVRTLNAWR